MFYHLLQLLKNHEIININPFQYITVRCAAAGMMSLLISWAIGGRVIAVLRLLKAGQPIRTVSIKGAPDLAEMHGKKAGTPTMGGVLIIFCVLVSSLFWCNLLNPMIWLLVFVTLGFGTIGFLDDYLKITKKKADGLAGRYKILGQLLLGLFVGAYLYLYGNHSGGTDGVKAVSYQFTDGSYHSPVFSGYGYMLFPFFKWLYPYIGVFFVLFVIVVFVGASNAVNLTDGLDGLCIGITAVVTAAFTVVAYLASNAKYADYLMIPYVPRADEIVVFMGALFGACLGFLWYNAYPADMFMGDTGSLTLGGVIATVAVICKQEFLLAIIGGMYVIECLSVILQVASYKLTKRRIFLMAPIHHHFEKKGMTEAKIIARFWIVSILFCLIGLSTLKLR